MLLNVMISLIKITNPSNFSVNKTRRGISVCWKYSFLFYLIRTLTTGWWSEVNCVICQQDSSNQFIAPTWQSKFILSGGVYGLFWRTFSLLLTKHKQNSSGHLPHTCISRFRLKISYKMLCKLSSIITSSFLCLSLSDRNKPRQLWGVKVYEIVQNMMGH